MKKIFKLFIFLIVLLSGINVNALDYGQSVKVPLPNSYNEVARGSSDNLVFFDHYNVYKYDFENNSLNNIFISSNIQLSQVYARGNYAYVLRSVKGNTSQSTVDKVDILTGELKNTTTINRSTSINESFIVDLKGNYYFADSTSIYIYNVNGELINTITSSQKGVSSLIDFSPNDEYLFAQFYRNHELVYKLENGVLTSGEAYTYRYRYPSWRFASDKKMAVNNYGELVVFDFDNLTKPYTLKTEGYSPNDRKYVAFYETSDKFYIPNDNGYIVGVSKTDYKPKDKILINEGSSIVFMSYVNNNLYTVYLNDVNFYEVKVNLSNTIPSRNIVLNTHTTMSHTIDELRTKYNAAKPKADYSNHYKTAPSLTVPYSEGELKDEIVEDTLNQLNYYRYLAGLNSVTLNSSKMPRSQKGALIQAINKKLSHTPTQPEGMDDDFYQEAYYGCNARYAEGDIYSGNVSYNHRIDKSVGGFIDDTNNPDKNTGHRDSLLDPFAKQVSFGEVSPYVAMSVYYDSTNNNSEKFYAWPSAGYFPLENIKQKTDTLWSIWLDSKLKLTSESSITLTYNNQEYSITEVKYDRQTNVVSYKFPEAIINDSVGPYGTFAHGTTIHVNIKNLKDNDINTYEIDYDVNFVALEEIELENVKMIFTKQGSTLGTGISPNSTITIKKDYNYNLQESLTPSNATVGAFTYVIGDTSIAEINNKVLHPKKGGTTTLTVTDTYSNKSFVYNIKVEEQPTSVSFENTKITIKKGQRYKLNPIVTPSSASTNSFGYKTSNSNVAYISGDEVVGYSAGTATITFYDKSTTTNPLQATVEVTVVEDTIDVESISFFEDIVAVETGKTKNLSIIFTPTNATNKTITWSSSDTSIATVSNGVVTGVKKGTAIITAKSNNGKTDTCRVEVSDAVIPVTGVNVNKSSITLEVGDTETIVTTISPSNATIKTPNYEVIDSNIASVDANGKVTALKAGTTNIKVSAGNIAQTVTITVKNKNTPVDVTGITLNKTSLTLENGDTYTLTATITPYNATNKTVTWRSTDNNIATVTNGKVIAKGVGTVTITAETSNGLKATCTVTVNKAKTSIAYTTHVQNIGWQRYVTNGTMAGTSGKSYRLEGIKIKLLNQEYSGNVEYRTHIQNIGWEKNFKKNDEMSGTSGKSYRLEAIEIKLTGEIAEHYDIYYRVHAQNFGWLGWARNGEQSGTAGYAYRLEGIEIELVSKDKTMAGYGKDPIFWEKGKGSTKPNQNQSSTTDPVTPDPTPTPTDKLISYTTHVQNIGWQKYVSDGAMAGTSGKAYRLEGIKIKLENQQYDGDIEYRTHIQYLGWEKNFKKNDEMSGTEGKAYRLEAIEIKLTGEMADHYDVYYRVHAENFGWLGWAKNGEQAGTAGYAYRLEGIEIVLMEKGQTPEGYGKGNKPFYSK